MVPVVQLVRASDCGSECRGFESHRAPGKNGDLLASIFFVRPWDSVPITDVRRSACSSWR